MAWEDGWYWLVKKVNFVKKSAKGLLWSLSFGRALRRSLNKISIHCTLTVVLALNQKSARIIPAVLKKKLVTSSLGRYVFGSEISYNKAPPPPAWARLLSQSRKKSWDIEFQKVDGP